MGLLILTFFLGAAVGSFVNVLVERSIAGKDWIKGRSKCDHCGKTLAWYDMIPLLSYLSYQGKSRCCHKRLSWRHPLVELLFGTLFVWWLLVGFMFFRLAVTPLLVIQPLFWLITGVVLLIVAVADAYAGVILMPLVKIGVVSVVGYRIILWLFGQYQLVDGGLALLAGLGYAGFLAGLRYLTKGRGMGEGDPYLAFLLGVLVGWPRTLVAALLAFVVGAIVGIILIGLGKKKMGSTIPFGPFMVLGATLALWWGEAIIRFLLG